jgi:hypothetical protein
MKKNTKKLLRNSHFINLFVFILLFTKANTSSIVFAQNWNQMIKTAAQDKKTMWFGYSVAISGDYAIVGAIYEKKDTIGGNPFESSGSAFIFKNIEGTWTQVQKLVAPEREDNDWFGYSVAISGDYAIIGAPRENEDINEENTLSSSGSAYIFKNNSGVWLLTQKIAASDREAGEQFGYSVAISEDFAAIGAIGEDDDTTTWNTLTYSGSAFIFKFKSGAWIQTQKIVATDRGTEDFFGCSISISGDFLIVGAHREDHNVTGGSFNSNSGAAYIFKNNSGIWSQIQKIVASDREEHTWFGYSVSISGDYAVIGAWMEGKDAIGENPLTYAGSAYIFKNNGRIWSQVQKIVASDRDHDDRFGYSLAISGDYLIVSAYEEDHDLMGGNTLNSAGSAYIFKRNGETWTEVQKITALDRRNSGTFGWAVAISGDYAIVGAYNIGSAYFFKNNFFVDLKENSFGNGLITYPNPSKGNFSIDLGAQYENIKISITDILGTLIESKTISQAQILSLLINQPFGVYFIKIQTDNKRTVVRMVKE